MYGPRYWFEALPAYFPLSARGLHLAAHAVRRRWGRLRRRPMVRVALACQLLAAATHTFPAFAEAYTGNYAGPGDYLRPHLAELDRALVFLESNAPESMGNWIMAYDDPALSRSILVAHDRGYRNHDLAERFPDRPTYRYTIFFHGNVLGASVVYERFQPIDTAAELEAQLLAEDKQGTAAPASGTP